MCLWVRICLGFSPHQTSIWWPFLRFGVCCVHIIDDDDDTDVNHNDTYIQNPNFPSAYDEDNDINYKVNKVSDDICFLRLDFEQFQTNRDDTTGACQDRLEITTQSGINPPEQLCGTLTGQHSEFAFDA